MSTRLSARVVAPGARDLAGQALVEGAVVGQAGQRVGEGLRVEPVALLGVDQRRGHERGEAREAVGRVGRQRRALRRGGGDDAPEGVVDAHGRDGERVEAELAHDRRDARVAGVQVRRRLAAVGDRDAAAGLEQRRALALRPHPEHGAPAVLLVAHDDAALGLEQHRGLLGDELEDVVGVVARRDRRRDVQERPVLELGGLRPGQVAVQAAAAGGDGHRDRREAGQDDRHLARRARGRRRSSDEGRRDGQAGEEDVAGDTTGGQKQADQTTANAMMSRAATPRRRSPTRRRRRSARSTTVGHVQRPERQALPAQEEGRPDAVGDHGDPAGQGERLVLAGRAGHRDEEDHRQAARGEHEPAERARHAGLVHEGGPPDVAQAAQWIGVVARSTPLSSKTQKSWRMTGTDTL